MHIINCVECGKVCLTDACRHCPVCRQVLWQCEEKILAFLGSRRPASLDEIRTATGIPAKTVLQLIKGRRFAAGSVSYPCEGCRQLITRGRRCVGCAENISLTPGSVIHKPLAPTAKATGLFPFVQAWPDQAADQAELKR